MNVRHITFERGDGRGSPHAENVHDDGFGRNSLCGKCNSKTGSVYGQAYATFIQQFSSSGILEDDKHRALVHLEGIYPSRVLKQLYSMYLSIQPNTGVEQWRDLRHYVLRRDFPIPSDAPRVFLYRNVSRQGRIVPVCGLAQLARPVGSSDEPVIFSELSWPPLGVVFVLNRDDYFAEMPEITAWSRYGFKQQANFDLTVPRLRVETDWPLGFGTSAEIEAWINALGLLWFVVDAEDRESPTSVSMTYRKER